VVRLVVRLCRERRAASGLIAILLFSASAGADSGTEAAAAEALASARYYDSFPYEEARALTDAGVARLAELLADPTATGVHAHAVLALGVCRREGAFETLVRHAARVPDGEVSSAVYRSRATIPIAMGHLAASDDRALAYLIDAFQNPPARASWRYSVLDEEKIARKLRRDAASGLATSGRPEAGAALASAIAGPAARQASEFSAHVAAVLDLHQRVARDGAHAVFGSDR